MTVRNPYLIAAAAALVAWQASDFSLDYRDILAAIVCAVLGYTTPTRGRR